MKRAKQNKYAYGLLLNDEVWGELEYIALKIRGLGLLLESHIVEAEPIDAREAWQGMGLILNEISREVFEVWKTLDAQSVKEITRRNRKTS